MSDVYYVQWAYRRPATPKENKPDETRAVKVVEEVTDTAGNCEKQKVAFRQLTDEQQKAELKPMHDRDQPTVRRMFDLLDASNEGKELPDGTRVRQGDLVAPGLVISSNPFPAWLDAVLLAEGFNYDEGCISYVREAAGKGEAERWYQWIWEIIARDEARKERSEDESPLKAISSVFIREDHRLLLQGTME
jgi:hypothetical protein